MLFSPSKLVHNWMLCTLIFGRLSTENVTTFLFVNFVNLAFTHPCLVGFNLIYLIVSSLSGWTSFLFDFPLCVSEESHLGPLLFFLFINDVVGVFTFPNCLMKTDDSMKLQSE